MDEDKKFGGGADKSTENEVDQAGEAPTSGAVDEGKAERGEDNVHVPPKEEKGAAGDPFSDYTAPSAPTPRSEDKSAAAKTDARRERENRKLSTKIAYAAAGTAIAAVCSVVTVYLPVKIVPLVVAAFCFFLVHVKSGVVYGTISAAATVLITFLCGGVCSSLLFLSICFFPYSIVCLPLRRFDYRKPVGALIRAATAIVLGNLAFLAIYFIARYITLGGLDVLAAVGKLGYALIALIVGVAAVITDLLFTLCDKTITPKIK